MSGYKNDAHTGQDTITYPAHSSRFVFSSIKFTLVLLSYCLCHGSSSSVWCKVWQIGQSDQVRSSIRCNSMLIIGLQCSANHPSDASERLSIAFATNNLVQGGSNSGQLDKLNTIKSV